MIDYTVRHPEDVPDYSLPPVHFDGVRFSGDGLSNKWGAGQLNPILPKSLCDDNSSFRSYLIYSD